MKKKWIALVFLLSAFAMSAFSCVSTSSTVSQKENKTESSGFFSQKPTEIPVTQTEKGGVEKCSGLEPVVVSMSTNLWDEVTYVTHRTPSMNNLCFAIFNISHGVEGDPKTNLVYYKNGYAYMFLLFDVVTPWSGDLYLIGDPSLIEDKLNKENLIDEDTTIVDGGSVLFWKGDEVVKVVDWSSVHGGVFENEVKFEITRFYHEDGTEDDNKHVWIATCQGQEFKIEDSHNPNDEGLNAALSCGLAGNRQW